MALGDAGKTIGLATVFWLVTSEVAVASMTGAIGIHGPLVDFGAAVGEDLGIPQVDWTNLWNNQELSFIDPEIAANCVESGGHMHGNNFCHYGPDTPQQIAQLPQTPSTPTAPVVEDNVMKLE